MYFQETLQGRTKVISQSDTAINYTVLKGNDENIWMRICMDLPGKFNKKQVAVTNERRCGPYTPPWII